MFWTISTREQPKLCFDGGFNVTPNLVYGRNRNWRRNLSSPSLFSSFLLPLFLPSPPFSLSFSFQFHNNEIEPLRGQVRSDGIKDGQKMGKRWAKRCFLVWVTEPFRVQGSWNSAHTFTLGGARGRWYSYNDQMCLGHWRWREKNCLQFERIEEVLRV